MKPARLALLATTILTAPFAVSAQQATATKPSEIPLEAFFTEPDIVNLQISPDGNYASFMAVLGTGHVGVALMHLDTGKIEPFVGPRDEDISFYFWKGDDRIVYGGDVGGNEWVSLRSIGLSSRHVTSLAESLRARSGEFEGFASLVDELKGDPNNILIWGNKERGSFAFGYWTVNVKTGRRWLVEGSKPTRDSDALYPGATGTILAREEDDGENKIYRVRGDSKSSYTQVAKFPSTADEWSIVGFSGDDSKLYVFTNYGTELRTIDTHTRSLSEPIFMSKDGTVESLILSEDRNTLYGVVCEGEKRHYHWFDKSRAQLQAQIDATLPNTFNFVVSRSTDEKLMAIAAVSDVDPGTYYILDLRAPRLMKVGQVRSKIDPKLMRPMEPVQFTARDGLVIHGYLTRPAAHADTPGPLIIHPHGGPFGLRDSWGFDPDVQFLASRGYAVLQVNYRGSGGYGLDFERAGWKEWGGKMQDDLTDAVQWAVDNKIADPKRVAIYGGSYGGYAALAGVTFTPDLYQCAINYVGVSDLKILLRSKYLGSNFSERFVDEMIGSDPEYIRTHSPVNFVERIKVPTMHIYGYNDPRVDLDHWKRLRAKLVEFNKPFEEVFAQEEGHGFDDEKTRVALYKRIEAFLAKNLPADN